MYHRVKRIVLRSLAGAEAGILLRKRPRRNKLNVTDKEIVIRTMGQKERLSLGVYWSGQNTLSTPAFLHYYYLFVGGGDNTNDMIDHRVLSKSVAYN